MAKVTVRSEEDANTDVVQKQKPKFESVTDSLGRVIQLRQLDPLQQSRLVMAVGGEVSSNSAYMNGFALPAAMVAFVDDEPFGLPQNLAQIETRLTLLGNEGIAAIGEWLVGKYNAAKEAAEDQEKDAMRNAAKN
ncbi:hypothetical protein [Chromobacterium haemolyticum]|uniref:Uncharacterized protein n=1 Tax=Chromobacterium haemolyticum TaxID=394935 RepID=A0A1W0D5R8_9NEIS|nr:hypothetical protein [Chromobacterium haemolyticum]OQS42336.1 hypothetical protein B0T45_05990 [Chromobacterium haemolyticum]